MSRDRRITGREPIRSVTRRLLLSVPLLAGVSTLVGCSRGSNDNETSDDIKSLVAWPAKDIWPRQLMEMPQPTQDNYHAAVKNKALLQYIPCYCGCFANGHTSVFDCYVAEERADGSIVLDTMSFG